MSNVAVRAAPGLGHALDLVILIGFLLVSWQGMHFIAGEIAMTTPLQTLHDSIVMLGSGDFWPNVVTSGEAFLAALAISVVAGPILGMILGFHKPSGEVVEPILVSLYSIPKVILYPIILTLFGIGMASEVAFGVLNGLVPVMLFTMSSVRNIRPVLIKTGRVMNLTTAELMRQVLLPAALPEIFTGLRMGFSVTLLGIIMSEMFGSKRGIGFMLMASLGTNNVHIIMALTLLMVAFAALANTILMSIEKRLYHR
jgi:NitT/TauT family transport system permease protein